VDARGTTHYRARVASSDRSCRFRVVLCEADTGVVLAEDGTRHVAGRPRFEPGFDTLDRALQCKDRLLARFPFAEVWIVDSEDAARATRHFDRAGYARFAAARGA
jgi:hypothetical protein